MDPRLKRMFSVQCDSCKNNKFWINSDYFYVCESCGLCVKDFKSFEEDVKYFQRKSKEQQCGVRCVQEYRTIYHFSQICRRFFLKQTPPPPWMITLIEEELRLQHDHTIPCKLTKQHIWKALDSLQKKQKYATPLHEEDLGYPDSDEEDVQWSHLEMEMMKESQLYDYTDSRVMRRKRALSRAKRVTSIYMKSQKTKRKRQWKHLKKYWIHIRYLITGVKPEPEVPPEMFSEMLQSFGQLYIPYLYVMTNKDVQKTIGVRRIWPRLSIVAEMILRMKGYWHDNFYEYFESVRSESCIKNYVVIVKGVLRYCNINPSNHPQLNMLYLRETTLFYLPTFKKQPLPPDEDEEFMQELANKLLET